MQRCPSSSILNEALCFLQQSGIGSDDFTQISIRWCAKVFLYLCVYSVKSRFLCVDLQIDKKTFFYMREQIHLSVVQTDLCLDAKHCDLSRYAFTRIITLLCTK